MTVRDAMNVLGARVLVGEEFLDQEVKSACGSDMMSDVLAFSKDHSILLTGLCNPQVIRTAEMLDIVCIIFVRGQNAGNVVGSQSSVHFVVDHHNRSQSAGAYTAAGV